MGRRQPAHGPARPAGERHARSAGGRGQRAGPDLDSAAGVMAALLHHWLTKARDRQLARFELSLEATRRPELRADLQAAGLATRSRVAALLAALGAPRPAPAADLLVAWTDGFLYDRLAGALAATRPVPEVAELTVVARRMLEAALAT
ncbi:hypothetical protein [Streptomyces sp. NPDC003401]